MYRDVQFMTCTDEEISRQIALAAHYGKNQVKRVFLADGDALVLSTEKLLKILKVLFETFPKLQRVSSYAAPKDILRKSVEELQELEKAGLKLLYYGMETGDDAVLKAVNKGVSGPEAVEAGKRVVAAGMKLSIMIILGLAGADGSDRHARETAKAINEIKPNMLSAITLMLYRGSELLDQYERGEFAPLNPQGIMLELHKIISLVELPPESHCLFRSNHVSNYVQLAATLPKEKDRLLQQIALAADELGKWKNWDVYNNNRY